MRQLEMVDERGDAGCAEAVVDVDYRDVGGTGVQHAEERGDSAERCAVADAGGDGEDGSMDKSADDGGQSSFHAGADDEHAGGLERCLLGEKAMDAGDADVGDELDGVA